MQGVHAGRGLRHGRKHTPALQPFLRIFYIAIYIRKRRLAKTCVRVAGIAPVYLRYIAVAQIGIAIYKAKNNLGCIQIYPNAIGGKVY